MITRLRCMLIKEFIQMLNDPRMRGVLFVAPIIQILVFGYAVTTDVNNVRTAIYDLDASPESRDLVARFLSSEHFAAVAWIGDDETMRDRIDHGTARVVLRINSGFGETVRGGRTAPFQLILDGTDPNTAGIVLNYAMRITEQFNTARRGEHGPAAVGGVEMRTRAWFNENLESRNFYLPPVVAQIVMIVTLMLSAMAIVREKEIGTIEQIMVTPIRKVEYVLGKMIPFAIVGFLDVTLIAAVAYWKFDVPIRGNILLLYLAAGLFLLSTLGVGLLISTVSRTQQQAMMTAFFFNLPATLLSGFMYPIANMPPAIQALTFVNPLRYCITIIRGIFLKGVGFDVLWDQYLALAVLGVGFLALASIRFRKVTG